MPRNIETAILTALAKAGQEDLLALVELDIPKVKPATGIETIRYALWDGGSITYDGNAYTNWNGSFGTLEERSDGEQPAFPLTLQNVSRFWSQRINDLHNKRQTLNGTPVRIHVFYKGPEGPSALISYENVRVSGYSVDNENVEFNITSPFDALRLATPRQSLGGRRLTDEEVPGGPQLWIGWPFGLKKRRR